MSTKIKELTFNEEELMGAVFAISLVDLPAIEEDFIALNQSKHYVMAKVDEEKRLLYGPALIPNKLILRIDEETGEEYYVTMSKEVVKKSAHNYIRKGFQNQWTEQHEKQVEGISVVESWMIEDSEKDKSALYGFKLQAGTWFVVVKVNNDEIWNKIKKKEIRGFSIEGFFVEKLSKKETESDEFFNELLEKTRAIM